MDLNNFSRLTNEASKSFIILKGLGTIEEPHPDLVNFLTSLGYEVHYFNREADKLLETTVGAIEDYQELVLEYTKSLVETGKQVNLMGISFGGYLTMKCAQNFSEHINSIVAIAPLISPYSAMNQFGIKEKSDDVKQRVELSNGQELDLLRANIEPLKDEEIINIDTPGIVTMGTEDGITGIGELDKIEGDMLVKRILRGVNHNEITGNSVNVAMIKKFLDEMRV